MASDHPGHYRHPFTDNWHPTGINYFSQPPLRSEGYMGQELGRMQQHHHSQGDQLGLSSQYQPHFHPQPHPLSSYQPHDLHEAIKREIEKERIREEIIMSEIFRRRALEAEVRREFRMEREFMMERELALQGRSNGFPYVSSSPMGLDMPRRFPPVETRAVGRLNNTRESDLSASLPFQSASDDVRAARNSEVQPILEGVKEKKKIFLQATPIKNITGVKRASDSHSDGNLKKKLKEEWSCALCKVSPTSDQSLIAHLEGKKHKTKEAEVRAQKAGKNYIIGFATKKVGKPVQDSRTVDPCTGSEMEFTSESLPSSATHDLPPSQEKLALDGNLSKKEKEEWSCALCEVGPTTERALNEHLEGKKHKRKEAELRAQKAEKNYSVGLGTKNVDRRVQNSGSVDPCTGSEMKFTSDSLPGSATHDLPPSQEKVASDGNLRKKVKEDWSCALCKVGPTTERALNVHLEGKKHKKKEAELRAQKAEENYTIGLATMKIGKRVQNSGTVDPCTGSEMKFTSGSLPGSATHDLPPSQEKVASDGNLRKKVKEEWSCALCKVGPTTERALNVHLEGKKHKKKEAELRAQMAEKNYSIGLATKKEAELRAQMAEKNYSIGLATKKVGKPFQDSENVDPCTGSEMNSTSESLLGSAAHDLPPSQEKLASNGNLKMKESEVTQEVHKNDKPEYKYCRLWCEMCQIGVVSQKVMDLHVMGKKHKRQLAKRNECSGVGPSQKDGAAV